MGGHRDGFARLLSQEPVLRADRTALRAGLRRTSVRDADACHPLRISKPSGPRDDRHGYSRGSRSTSVSTTTPDWMAATASAQLHRAAPFDELTPRRARHRVSTFVMDFGV